MIESFKKILDVNRLYIFLYFLSFSIVCTRSQNLHEGHADELHDIPVISVLNACSVSETAKVCGAYMCVLYVVF